MSHVTFFFFFFVEKMVDLVGGGPTPSSLIKYMYYLFHEIDPHKEVMVIG